MKSYFLTLFNISLLLRLPFLRGDGFSFVFFFSKLEMTSTNRADLRVSERRKIEQRVSWNELELEGANRRFLILVKKYLSGRRIQKRFKNKLIIHKFLFESETYHSQKRKLGFHSRTNNLCCSQLFPRCSRQNWGLSFNEKLKTFNKIERTKFFQHSFPTRV